MITDPISDMLTRLRNASAVKKPEVLVPFSKIKMRLAELLLRNGYLAKAERAAEGLGDIKIELKYANHLPAFRSLKRISTPGRRVYVSKEQLPKVCNEMGLAIISTSQGLMTNREARKKKIGGEVLCEIY